MVELRLLDAVSVCTCMFWICALDCFVSVWCTVLEIEFSLHSWVKFWHVDVDFRYTMFSMCMVSGERSFRSSFSVLLHAGWGTRIDSGSQTAAGLSLCGSHTDCGIW